MKREMTTELRDGTRATAELDHAVGAPGPTLTITIMGPSLGSETRFNDLEQVLGIVVTRALRETLRHHPTGD